MVFFGSGKSMLNARARQILSEFQSVFSIYDQQEVDLLASTDTSETKDRGYALAKRRGEAVAMALREEGAASYATISIQPSGRDRLVVPTPENTPEPQNRNVILVFRDGRQLRPTWRQAACREWLVTHPCGTEIGTKQGALCSQVRRVADEFKG